MEEKVSSGEKREKCWCDEATCQFCGISRGRKYGK